MLNVSEDVKRLNPELFGKVATPATRKHKGVAIEIPMAPFGKARPRVTKNGTFMPTAYEDAKETLRNYVGAVPDGMVHIAVTAVRPMPKSWSKKKRERMNGRYTTAVPDIDNILGAVMDALFEDDSAVVSGFTEKIWGTEGKLVVSIDPIKEDNNE